MAANLSEQAKQHKREYNADYSKKTKYAAQNKYNANNMKAYSFRFSLKTDSDIIEHLEAQENKAGYIKDLIRADMQK